MTRALRAAAFAGLLIVGVFAGAFAGCDAFAPGPSSREIAAKELPPQKGNRRAASNAFVKRAQEAVGKGRMEQAAAWLETAIHLDPANPYAYHVLGLIEYRERDFKSAEGLFQKAFTLYGDAENDWAVQCATLLGDASERMKHWHSAKAAYRFASERAKDNSRAKTRLLRIEKRLAENAKKQDANAGNDRL